MILGSDKESEGLNKLRMVTNLSFYYKFSFIRLLMSSLISLIQYVPHTQR